MSVLSFEELRNSLKTFIGENNSDEALALIENTEDTITNYENNLRNPSDAIIVSICREFNVNEEWLRTGNGEIFQPITKDDEISKLFGEVLKENNDDFKRRLISALAKLDDVGWEKLENLIDNISNKK